MIRRQHTRGLPVRFRILGVLLVLSFVNYLLRNNISVVLPFIREEFAFSNTELGWILGSFNVAYALFQIPGGVAGARFGPRRVLTIIALTWGVLTLATGFVPGLMMASGTGALVSFMAVRFFMGVANAPLFPVSAGAFESWFPVGNWALPNSLQSVGLTLGQASLGPLVTLLIVQFGWRASFYFLAPAGFIVAAWWWWYGRDRPVEHAAVARDELDLIRAGRAAEVHPGNREQLGHLAGQSRMPALVRQLLLHELCVLHVCPVAVHLSGRRARFQSP